MSNAADRDSDQFGIKMSAARDLSLAGRIPQPCSKKRRKVGTTAKVSNTTPHLRHSDKLKHGVPGGQTG